MNSHTFLRCAVLAASVGLLAASPSAAQDIVPSLASPVRRIGDIEGFAGFRWGATEEQIIAERGEPDESKTVEGGARELTWNNARASGRAARLTFTIVPGRGLGSGLYMIPHRGGDDCQALFDMVVRDIRARYPQTAPTVSKRNGSSLDLCGGILIERAEAAAMWRDVAETVIYVSVLPGTGILAAGYQTAEYTEWERRVSAEERVRTW